jgi:hypothetical protein
VARTFDWLDPSAGGTLIRMDPQRKARWIRQVEKRTFNRLFVRLVRSGRASPYAIVETTGRRSGLPRQVPVANGLQG